MNLNIDYRKHLYQISATPQPTNSNQTPAKFKITLDGYSMGYISCAADEWKSDNIIDQNLVDLIGSFIEELYTLQQ
jgi:hypothetical protein